jgi:hypothetical protein
MWFSGSRSTTSNFWERDYIKICGAGHQFTHSATHNWGHALPNGLLGIPLVAWWGPIISCILPRDWGCLTILLAKTSWKPHTHGCHADVFERTNGWTDDQTMAAGASVTWTHCSVLLKLPGGKTLASARTRTCIRADGQRLGHGCQGTI